MKVCFFFLLDLRFQCSILTYVLDSHFTAAAIRHIKDLAGIFGNDCVFYLTQDTKSKVNIGRPSAKGQSPLIMRLDYDISSLDSQTSSMTNTRHQFSPW